MPYLLPSCLLGAVTVAQLQPAAPPENSLADLLSHQDLNDVENPLVDARWDPSHSGQNDRPENPLVQESPPSEVQAAAVNDAAGPNGELCEDFYRFHREVLQTSPFLRYVKHFDKWLRESSYQASIAISSLLFGALCSWNGPKLWELIVITCFSLSAVWLVRFEAEQRQLAPNIFAELLLMIMTGCTVALSVHSGFEGSQVLLGSILGFLGAVYCGLANLTQSAGFLKGMTLSWYLAGSAFGVWVFTSWRQPLLATLAPLTGSFLVVVGIGFLLGRGLQLSALPRPDEPWSSAAMVLLGPLGVHAIPWHGVCALVAASLHSCKRQIWAVLVLVGYVILVALGALVAGFDCDAGGKRSDGTDCPKTLAVAGRWQWQLLGCSLWALLAAWCGYRQLSALKNVTRRSGRYVPVEETMEAQVPVVSRSPMADPYVTRLPAGYGPQALPYQPGGLYKYVKSRH